MTGAPLSTKVGICKLWPVEGLRHCASNMEPWRNENFCAIFCMASLSTQIAANNASLSTCQHDLAFDKRAANRVAAFGLFTCPSHHWQCNNGKAFNEPHASKWFLNTRLDLLRDFESSQVICKVARLRCNRPYDC